MVDPRKGEALEFDEAGWRKTVGTPCGNSKSIASGARFLIQERLSTEESW